MSRLETRRRWERLIEEQGRSGLSIAEFCRRKRTSQASFYLWRRKLQSQNNGSGRAAFVPLAVVSSAGVDVDLPGGAVVHVPPGDDRVLRLVLSVVMDCQAEQTP